MHTRATTFLVALLSAGFVADGGVQPEPLYRVVHGPTALAFDGAQVVAAERVELDADQ